MQSTHLLDTRPAVGDAWFPSVTVNVPGIQGLLLCVRATPQQRCAHRIETSPDDRLTQAVHAWVASLVGVQDPRVLGLPRLHVTVPPHGFVIDGPSSQLAGAVALISHLLGAAPLVPALCSGELAEHGRVTAVDEIDAKRSILDLEAPGYQPQVLIDREADAAPLFARWFGEQWLQELKRATVLSPYALVSEAWQIYGMGSYPLAEIKAAEAARIGAGHTRARAEWLVGACRVHRGEAQKGLELMKAAEAALLQAPVSGDAPLDTHAVQELRAFSGIAMLDLWDARRARALLASALEEVTATPTPWGRQTVTVVLQVGGSLHRACVLDGDLCAAEAALRDWGLGAAWLPEEEARCRIDLAEVLRRAGRQEEACAELERAHAALPAALEGVRPRTRRFMNLYQVRAGVSPARWPIEEPRWEDWPQPAEVLESLLARPAAELDAWIQKHILEVPEDQDCLTRYLVTAGAVARFEALHGELISCAAELVRRIEARAPGMDPSMRAALSELTGDAPESWVRRSPY